MPSARKPVIVEVAPSDAGKANVSPSSPPGSPGKKQARFVEDLVDAVSRPLSRVEEWSLYYFEKHARSCRICMHTIDSGLKHGALCSEGCGLALDVSEHVYYRSGAIYGKSEDDKNTTLVEVRPGYDQVRGLLKGLDRLQRGRTRTVPVIQQEVRTPSPQRRREEAKPRKVVVEPSRSTRTHRRSSHRQKHYDTVVLDGEIEAQPSRRTEPKSSSRRGSMYEAEIERQRKERSYKVEIREPSSRYRDDERRERDDRRRSSYYYD